MTSTILIAVISICFFGQGLVQSDRSERRIYDARYERRYDNRRRNEPIVETPPPEAFKRRIYRYKPIVETPPPKPNILRRYKYKPVETPPPQVVRQDRKKYVANKFRILNVGRPKVPERKPYLPKVQLKYTPSYRKTVVRTCLRKGCSGMNYGGLFTSYLVSRISGAKRNLRLHTHKSLLKVVTWNVDESDIKRVYDKRRARSELCTILKKMSPTIFGLQHANLYQINALRKCLPSRTYSSFVGGRTGYNRQSLYNPIFYKFAHVNTLSTGSISVVVNRKRAVVATYMKVRFPKPKPQTRAKPKPTPKKKRNNIKDFFARMREIMNRINANKKDIMARDNNDKGKQTYNEPSADILIVNVNLDQTKSQVAEEQMKKLLVILKSKTNQWRNPAVLMGCLGVEDNSQVYQNIVDHRKFVNTMDKRTNPNAFPSITRYNKRFQAKDVVDYIWQHNLKTVLSATIKDRQSSGWTRVHHRPVFAVFALRK